jgi:hypothetical protein
MGLVMLGSVTLAGPGHARPPRLGFCLTPDTELPLSGHTLLNSRHLEANGPSTHLPQYVPQSLLLTLRQRL